MKSLIAVLALVSLLFACGPKGGNSNKKPVEKPVSGKPPTAQEAWKSMPVSDAASFHRRGVARIAAGDAAGATGDFDEAIRLDPKMSAAYRDRGHAWFLRGDMETAIGNLDKAVELDSSDAQAFLYRGLAWSKKGDTDTAIGNFDTAIGNFDKAVELKPSLAAAYVARGVAWLAKGNQETALGNLDKALGLEADNVFALRHRGELRRAMGNEQGAKEDLDRAQKLADAAKK